MENFFSTLLNYIDNILKNMPTTPAFYQQSDIEASLNTHTPSQQDSIESSNSSPSSSEHDPNIWNTDLFNQRDYQYNLSINTIKDLEKGKTQQTNQDEELSDSDLNLEQKDISITKRKGYKN